MSEDKELTKEKLQKLCMQFDKEHKSYPEHEWEGIEVFEYICNKLDWHNRCPTCNEDRYLEVENEWDHENHKFISFKYIWKHYGLDDDCHVR